MSASLGQTWIQLVERILREGTPMAEEGLEILGASVAFRASTEPDEILEHFADPAMLAEMQKVFFREGPNALGHSYAKLICGPEGRNDLSDVTSLLQREPLTKRALVTFANGTAGKVPCINAVQFLVRDQALQVFYFARGQDVFRKFYADGHCLITMAATVAMALELPTGIVRGLIGSGHIYHRDMPAIRETLNSAKPFLSKEPPEGILA